MGPSKKAQRLGTLPAQTVWHEMTPLAVAHKAVNLGQGFPSFAPPDFLLDEIRRLLDMSESSPLVHQYAHLQGNPELLAQIKRMYTQRLNRAELADTNILITNGTTQGLNIIFQALLNPGDEVIIFEPFYDAYVHDIQLAGGVVRYVQLTPGAENRADAWSFTDAQLNAALSDRTRMILVNTPQNVPGKRWTRDELQRIAHIAVDRDLIVVSDEVYMSLVYDGAESISLASLPGMWDRTVTLCSIGKTFSCTGWKIGWAVGPVSLISALGQVASYQTFCVATPLQIAVARALRIAEGNGFYEELVAGYTKRRELLCGILAQHELSPIVPSGGFFVLADISRVDPKHYYNPDDKDVGRDWQFCRWLTKNIGVCAIPVTAFCSQESRVVYEKYVRFAFCKTEEDIKEAGNRLAKLREYFI